MAVEEGLAIIISAKVDNAVKNTAIAKKAIAGVGLQVQQTTAQATAGFNAIQKAVEAWGGGVTKQSKIAVNSFNEFKSAMTNAGKAGATSASGINTAATAAAKTTTNFTGLSRILQDLPFGFVGIQNNLTQLLPAAGAAGLAISAIVSAVTFASVGFGAWTRGLTGNKQAVDDQKDAVKKAKEETDAFKNSLDGARSGAVATGISLRAFVDIAKDGNRPLAERNEALEQANKIMGEHGEKLTLVNINTKAVTETVNKFTEALVQQAIAAKYADRVADLTIKQTDNVKAYNKALSERGDLEKVIKKEQQAGDFTLSQYNRMLVAQNNIKNAGITIRNTNIEIKDTNKDFNNSLSQSISLMGGVSGKAKKVKKEITYDGIIKDLNKELRGLNGELEGGFIDDDAFDKSLVSAYQKAIKSLNEISADPSKIAALQVQIQPVIDRLEVQKELDELSKKRIKVFTEVEKSKPLDPFPETFERKFTSTDSLGAIKEGPLHILDQIIEKQDKAKKSAQLYNETINDLGKGLVSTFENVFVELIEGGGNALKIFGRYIQGVIMKLIAAAAIAAILTAVTGGAFGGAAIKGGTNFMSRFAAIGNLPFHAAGGITTGPHAAMVGDNPSGKEAIIHFERMGEFLDNFSGGGNMEITGELILRGDDLVTSIRRTEARQGRSYGG